MAIFKAKKSDERQERWDALLAEYKKQSPEKFAAKEAAGLFKTIPGTFQ